MDFRTEIKPVKGQEGLITHASRVVLVGSCFTDNIGACMRDELFDVTVNPFGPIYNPASVLRAIEILVDGRHIEESDLFENEGRWHSFSFHSRYSAPSKAEALLSMNGSIESAREALKKADVLIVTLGTTRIFSNIASGEIVANCHKIAQSQFDERTLALDECVACLNDMVSAVRRLNDGVNMIFTVSPLRYLNHGAHVNTLSKSTLMLAIDSVISSNQMAHYFPAFEIMMDDLRDYRFYAEDMKHPSAQAVKYIYDIFSSTYYTSETRGMAQIALRFTRRLAHRPLSGRRDAEETTRIINDFKMAMPLLVTNIDRYIADGI